MKSRQILIAGILTMVALTGCATSSDSAQVYSKGQMRQMHEVEYGKILDIKNVKMEGDKNDLLTLGGTALGGLAGSNIGKGSGSVAGAIVGAMAGGLASEAVQRNNTKNAYELTVQMEKGRTVSIVQEADVVLTVGQRVKVITGGGTARVLPM